GLAMATKLEEPPLDWLDGTPFRSYLIPSLLLAFVVGGSATFATVAMLLDGEAGGAGSAVAGGIMMGWIAVEFRMLDQPSWLQALYFGAGLLMTVLAAVVWF
ncbi:MAG TPA: hypothetical protein VFS30_08635, partial [Dehalococcoidia bacterium]|nr:hypothetical protein [Dehalococcoidia bacterium]